MQNVLIAAYLLIVLALIGVILLQRSEGGGLGMGGGGGGGFMTGRGTANLLTRVTAGLAALFFVTSISLTLLAKHNSRGASPLDLPQLNQLPKSGAPPASGTTTPVAPAAPGTATPGTPTPGTATPAAATPEKGATAPVSSSPETPANKSAPPPKSQ